MVDDLQPVADEPEQPDLGLTPDVSAGAEQDDPDTSDDVDDDDDEEEGEDDE